MNASKLDNFQASKENTQSQCSLSKQLPLVSHKLMKWWKQKLFEIAIFIKLEWSFWKKFQNLQKRKKKPKRAVAKEPRKESSKKILDSQVNHVKHSLYPPVQAQSNGTMN